MVTTKKALIVGINAYPAPYALQGCINDVNAWKAYLITQGFTVTTITDSSATKNNILSGLDTLLLGSVASDRRVFVFSGHGTQMVDKSGDETDGYDECIVPVNFTITGDNLITDDMLRAKIATVPTGVIIDMFFDSCHSGTVTRDLEYSGVRGISLPNAIRAPDKTGINKVFVPIATMKECCWAGCASNQTSSECSVGGIPRGIFSYTMLGVLGANPTYTRRQINTSVCSLLVSWGFIQVPQLECKTAEADVKIFN